MKFSFIKIQYPNGRVTILPYSSFDLYATNELEHKEENIIITLDDITHSFIYETDVISGEIVNKEQIKVSLLV
ncbi:MAG: hypothetical protein KBT32_12040 [Bacteroidales bacterium]|nr:hypothetical protein [Candidatus Physcocola equi]